MTTTFSTPFMDNIDSVLASLSFIERIEKIRTPSNPPSTAKAASRSASDLPLGQVHHQPVKFRRDLDLAGRRRERTGSGS